MNSQKTIELNGNLYDAVTGKMLGFDTSKAVTVRRGGKNIDGFFRSRATLSPANKSAAASDQSEKISVLVSPKATPKPVSHTPRAAASHARAHTPQHSTRVVQAAKPAKTVAVPQLATSKPANHAPAHKPQSAITLMRTAVKKPGVSLRAQGNVQGALAHNVPGLVEIKRPAAAIDTDRLMRATNVDTNPMVAHHGKQVPKVETSFMPLAVKPVPVKPEGTVPPAVPAPKQPNGKPGDNIFDHALANASHFVDVRQHRAHFKKQTRKHVFSMAAGTFALLVITGFALYQNSPGMQVKFASVQAGFATNTPNFKAAGFAYNGVTSGNGKVTVGFKDDTGRYQLSQQATNWSNSDMIQEVSATDASGRPNYTTVNANGTTVYRFNNTTATWVSNGKWYNVTGSNALSNDQVKSLVENV